MGMRKGWEDELVWFFISAVIVIGILIYAGYYFYGMAIKRAPKILLSSHRDLKMDSSLDMVSWEEGKEWVSRQPFKEIEITSKDGLQLKGYLLLSDRAEGRAVILAHGYSGKGKDMGACAKVYYENMGFHILLPDARGHGESAGDYIGFGWPERHDYLQWVEYLIKELGPEVQIILHGISMGGSTVLMTAGEELPPQVKAIISDCAYTSVKAQLAYQLWRMYRLPRFPFIQSLNLITRLKTGYSLNDASALKQVKKARVPILFIHGDADHFVPYRMMEELYEACPSPKEKYVVPQAGHGMAFDTNRTEYINVVTAFVNGYVH